MSTEVEPPIQTDEDTPHSLIDTASRFIIQGGYSWAGKLAQAFESGVPAKDAASVLVSLLSLPPLDQDFSPPPEQREQLAESITDGVQWILEQRADVLEVILGDETMVMEALTGISSRFVRDNNSAVRFESDPLRDGVQLWAATGGKDGNRWFREAWGRDTFISLPGILLTTGRFTEAKKLLETYATFEQDGIIPNRISDINNPDSIIRNTVDGSMWYLQALKRYVEVTGDEEILQNPEVLGAARSVIEHYITGTEYEHLGKSIIRSDDDGLVESSSQGTWMDAMPVADGQPPSIPPITPRGGKTVEVNALMKMNLEWMAEVEEKIGTTEKAEQLRQQAERLKAAFNKKFVNHEYIEGSDQTPIFDLIDPLPATKDFLGIPVDGEKLIAYLQATGYLDAKGHLTEKYQPGTGEFQTDLNTSEEFALHRQAIELTLNRLKQQQFLIRPNMMYAVVADLLDPETEVDVFRVVRDQLLLPTGAIRTLAPGQPDYHGQYHTEEPPVMKDFAYHEGTAWYNMTGAFCDMTVKVWPNLSFKDKVILAEKAGLSSAAMVQNYGGFDSDQALSAVIRGILQPAIARILTNSEQGGTLDEVCDADYPYTPGGNNSQAWSVAEVMRAYGEYVYKARLASQENSVTF